MSKKNIIVSIIAVIVIAILGVLGFMLIRNRQDGHKADSSTESTNVTVTTAQLENNNSNGDNNMTTSQARIKATVNGTELYAVLDDNATTRDFLAKLPITLPMQDLYDREMCYHFSEAFATDNLQSDNYEVGDIIYWPPRHSFVILYEQNGERFERQTLGHFESSVEIFKTTGDVEVKFELAE